MLRVILAFVVALPLLAGATTLQKKDLVGTWVSSGEMPKEKGATEYTLTIESDMSATYEGVNGEVFLECDYKPSSSQKLVFVWHCYLNEKHLITLSLAGWHSKSGALFFGYEYWLEGSEPSQIYGGLPLSLKLIN